MTACVKYTYEESAHTHRQTNRKSKENSDSQSVCNQLYVNNENSMCPHQHLRVAFKKFSSILKLLFTKSATSPEESQCTLDRINWLLDSGFYTVCTSQLELSVVTRHIIDSFVQCFRNQDAGKPQNSASQHCKTDVDQHLVCKVKLP